MAWLDLILIIVLLIFGYIMIRVVGWKRQEWRNRIGCPQPELLENGEQLLNFPGNLLLESPKWVDNYMKSCSWTINCEPDFNCAITCRIYTFSTTLGCDVERLYISTGEKTYVFCNTVFINLVSEKSKLDLVLFTHTRSVQFFCKVRSVKRPKEPCTCGRRNYTNWNKQESQSERNKDLVKKFPVIAAVVTYKHNSSYITKKEYLKACSATIIDTRHVLTLTTCYLSLGKAPKIVVVGVEDLKKGPSSSKQEYTIESDKPHPEYYQWYETLNYSVDYNYTMATYNLLLIRVASNENQIDFTNVSPACLPWKFADENFKTDRLTYLGYNRNMKLSRVDYKLCDKSNTYWIHIVKSYQSRLCVEFVNYSGENVSIGGGGPLLYEDPTTNGLLYIAGMVSRQNLRPLEDSPYNLPNYAVYDLWSWIQITTNERYCRI